MLSCLSLLSGCWKTVVKTEYVYAKPPVELLQVCTTSEFVGKTVKDLVDAKLLIDEELKACRLRSKNLIEYIDAAGK